MQWTKNSLRTTEMRNLRTIPVTHFWTRNQTPKYAKYVKFQTLWDGANKEGGSEIAISNAWTKIVFLKQWKTTTREDYVCQVDHPNDGGIAWHPRPKSPQIKEVNPTYISNKKKKKTLSQPANNYKVERIDFFVRRVQYVSILYSMCPF